MQSLQDDSSLAA